VYIYIYRERERETLVYILGHPPGCVLPVLQQLWHISSLASASPHSCVWLLLVALGYSWPLLPDWLFCPASSWLLLAALGCSWLLLAAPGCCWQVLTRLLLAPPGCSWLPLAPTPPKKTPLGTQIAHLTARRPKTMVWGIGWVSVLYRSRMAFNL
jgi:hypothetical protein